MKNSKRLSCAIALTFISTVFLQNLSYLYVTAEDPDKSIYMDRTQPIEQRVQALISQMTLEEKIGQTMQIDAKRDGDNQGFLEYIAQNSVGSVMLAGTEDPSAQLRETYPEWQTMMSNIMDASLGTRLGIPLLFEIDAVHGNNGIKGSTIFPHNIGLGAAKNSEMMAQIGRITAAEMAPFGFRGNFAPCIAVPQNIKWGRTYEGYSSDREIVAALGSKYIEGLQGGRPIDHTALNTGPDAPNQFAYLSSPVCVCGTMKHYFGEGLTVDGVNQGDVLCPDLPVDLTGKTPAELLQNATIRELLEPYKALIESGARSLMPSYSSINGIKMHEQKELLDLVKLPKERGGLGFTGFVVTDYRAYNQERGNRQEQFARCLNAGCDLIMLGQQWWALEDPMAYVEDMKEIMSSGKVSIERIDDAVRRILRVKFELGLFENPKPSLSVDQIGCQAHRDVARQAVRESLVLLKNTNGAIDKTKSAGKVFVIGRFANDIGNQCGGWTVSWQGKSGNITTGTTLLQAVKKVKGEGNVSFDLTGNRTASCSNPDVIVACIGELPYAEGLGDQAPVSPSRLWGEPTRLQIDRWQDAQVIETAKRAYPGVPVVAVIFSGRPLILESIFSKADAIVEAWLPGTEAEGITDVLFGDFDFTGRLPMDWPKCFEWIGDPSKEVMFPRGFGLQKH